MRAFIRKGSPCWLRKRDDEIERWPVPSLRATKNTRTNGLAVYYNVLLAGVSSSREDFSLWGKIKGERWTCDGKIFVQKENIERKVIWNGKTLNCTKNKGKKITKKYDNKFIFWKKKQKIEEKGLENLIKKI